MNEYDAFESTCPFGKDLQTYWEKRFDLFSKWNQGIKVDRQGLYTAKPETISIGMAAEVDGKLVIDGTCGVGSMTIALARSNHRVIAIDVDGSRLCLAQQNARIYGVEERIRFVQADIFDYLKREKADCLVCDPDWGGPGYLRKAQLRPNDLRPSANQVIFAGLQATRQVLMCLPVNFAFQELPQLPNAQVSQPKPWTMWGRTVCVTISYHRVDS